MIELAPLPAQGLVGPDGKPINGVWPPMFMVKVLTPAVYEHPETGQPTDVPSEVQLTGEQIEEAIYIQRRVAAMLSDGDGIQWTVYVHESLPMSGELAQDILSSWELL